MPRGRNVLGGGGDRRALTQRRRARSRDGREQFKEAISPDRDRPNVLGEENPEGTLLSRLGDSFREGMKPRSETERGDVGAAVRRSDGLQLAHLLTGVPVPDTNVKLTDEQESAGVGSPLEPIVADDGEPVEARGQRATDKARDVGEMQRVITKIEAGDLTEPAAVALEELKAELAVQAAEAENDLIRAKTDLDIQDVLFSQTVKDADLDLVSELDLDPLRSAILKEGGLGAQTLQAVTDIAASATLSEAEKNEAIDLVMTRDHFATAITETVEDMVQNLKDVEALEARADKDMLGNVNAFLHPTVDFDLQGADDAERWFNNFINFTIAGSEEVNNAFTAMPDGDWRIGVYDEAEQFAMTGQFDNQAYLQKLQKLEQEWGPDFGVTAVGLDAMFKAAAKKADKSEEDWNTALEADSLTPGSQEMIAALFQAGEESGFEPSFLALVAKSVDLHMLIDVKSKGKSGVANVGTTAGIGGLTAEMYEDMMGEPWTPTRGMQWELQALLEYINVHHAGDPIGAVQFWRQTGEWGGSTGLGDDDTGSFTNG